MRTPGHPHRQNAEYNKRRNHVGQLTAVRRRRSRPRLRCAWQRFVDPSIRVLARALESKRKLDRLAIMAARDVLDRNGFRPADQHSGQEDAPVHHVVSFVRPSERSE
jgi:hypothetical protein